MNRCLPSLNQNIIFINLWENLLPWFLWRTENLPYDYLLLIWVKWMPHSSWQEKTLRIFTLFCVLFFSFLVTRPSKLLETKASIRSIECVFSWQKSWCDRFLLLNHNFTLDFNHNFAAYIDTPVHSITLKTNNFWLHCQFGPTFFFFFLYLCNLLKSIQRVPIVWFIV